MFTIGWILWLSWFIIEEGLALYSKKSENTLSDHIWHWFGINPHYSKEIKPLTPWTRFRRILLLTFMAWLTVHFLTGGQF